MNQSNILYQCELGKEPLQLDGIPELYYFCDDNLYMHFVFVNFELDCKCNKFGKIP